MQVKAVQNPQCAIYCDNGFGPIFGGSTDSRVIKGGLKGKRPNAYGQGICYVSHGNQQGLDYLYNKHDLTICSNPQSSACTINLHHTYLCPGRFAAFMAEGHYFNVLEMEVFGLEK